MEQSQNRIKRAISKTKQTATSTWINLTGNIFTNIAMILAVSLPVTAHSAQQYNPVTTSIAIDAGYTEMLVPAYQGKILATGAYGPRRYPSASHNMQFIAFRNPINYKIYYVQTQDPNGQVIDWEVSGNSPYTLKLTVYSLSANFPDNFYITDTSMTALTQTEFFRKVARKYKTWAVQQSWAKRKTSTIDTMVTMAVAPDLRTVTMNDTLSPYINGWNEESKACWITFWRTWWQLGIDGGVPDYRMGGDHTAGISSINWMNSNKCSPLPYTNALLWDSRNVYTPGAGTTPIYNSVGGTINGSTAPAYNEIVLNNPASTYDPSIMIKDRYGEVASLSNNTAMKYVCQATSTWQNTFLNAANTIAIDGWKGIYFDMAAYSEPQLCYDTNHGHDIADPLAWQRGIRQLLTSLHNNATTKNLMVITEGNAEIYMDIVDGFLSYGDTGLADTTSPLYKQVPLFKEVYGDIARYVGWQIFPVANPTKTVNDLTPAIMSDSIKKAANYGSLFNAAPYFIGWEASITAQTKLATDANYASLFDVVNNTQYKKPFERGGGSINWTKVGTGSAPAAINVVDTETGAAAVSFGMTNRDSGEYYELPIGETKLSQLSWDMKMTGNYYILVTVAASDGKWYNLLYDQKNRDYRVTADTTLKFGLGADTTSTTGGPWRTIQRNLTSDLQYALSNLNVTINKVVVFRIYGKGLIDNLSLSNAPTIVEEGTTAISWTRVGSNLTNADTYDTSILSSVVLFSGMIDRDGGKYYIKSLNDTQHFDVAWDMKTSAAYYVLIKTKADDGTEWNLLYDQNARDFRLTDGITVKVGLGSDTTDGNWRTFRRNLADDLFEGTGKNISQVVEIRFYLAGSIDNVLLWGNGMRTSGR